MKFLTTPKRWGWTCIVSFSLATLILQPLSAQQKVFNPELLREDFTTFRKALSKDHAGLNRYKTEAVLNRLFDSCFAALNRPMSQLEFARSVMFMISAIEDGHTGTNIPRTLISYYGENERMFPVYVYYIDKKAYVLCSRKEQLAPGTEILLIDHMPVGSIRETLFQYLPSDGKIETKKQTTLNNGAFPFLYNLIFGNRDSFIVTYKNSIGKIETTSIRAEFVKDFECVNGSDPNRRKDLQLDFLQDEIAVLTVRTFLDKAGLNFREFLKSSFEEIDRRKAGKLVIDLRGNGGGADAYGALLYSYLAREPYNYFSSIRTTTRKISLKEDSLLGKQKPQPNSFRGDVFFLVNGSSFSTTADFCAISQSNNRGSFIGEETGGGYYGNTSGEITKTELPNSRIEILIPKWRYTNAVKKSKYKDRGVIPEYIIRPGIDEVITHKDVQMEFAIKLAQLK